MALSEPPSRRRQNPMSLCLICIYLKNRKTVWCSSPFLANRIVTDHIVVNKRSLQPWWAEKHLRTRNTSNLEVDELKNEWCFPNLQLLGAACRFGSNLALEMLKINMCNIEKWTLWTVVLWDLRHNQFFDALWFSFQLFCFDAQAFEHVCVCGNAWVWTFGLLDWPFLWLEEMRWTVTLHQNHQS